MKHARFRFRRGNAALMAALMLLPLSMLAGIGVDFGRAYVAGARLGQAVDAAALAGARVLTLRDPTGDAQMYFNANFNSANELASISPLTVTTGDTDRTLTVQASGTIATTFLALAGDEWRTLPIAASATARRTTLGMELALVLDVTGSMKDGNAIGALRVASGDLINILFGPQKMIDTLYVSIVPYAASINYGFNRAGWLAGGGFDATKYVPHRWRGCVDARAAPDDESDLTPIEKPFKPFLYPTTLGIYPIEGDNDWGPGKPPTDTDSLDPSRSTTNENARTGPNLGCGQPVAGLDNNRDRLLAIVAALNTTSRGGTMAPVGLQAGWNTLSPKWRGLWGTNVWGSTTPAGLPVNYGTPFMQKVIVMITDGANGWYDFGGKPSSFPPDSDYTSYGRREDGRLGVISQDGATTEINKRMLAMCGRIKATGIVIYTVTVDTGEPLSSATKAIYQQCATKPGYYVHAPDASYLRGIFKQIGSELSNLRLEK